MSASIFARDADGSDSGKPKSKRRYGGKNQKRRPSEMERIRARRDDPPRDNDFLDDFDGDTDDVDDLEDFEDFDDDEDEDTDDDDWDFEDDDER